MHSLQLGGSQPATPARGAGSRAKHGLATQLAAARLELVQLQQQGRLTEAGERWAAAAARDMERRARLKKRGGGTGGGTSRTVALAAELEAAHRELAALQRMTAPQTAAVYMASASDGPPTGQISVSAVTSAQRASATPSRAREYEPPTELAHHSDRASALAEAREELARLQSMAVASEQPKASQHPRESLAQLRAELEYLEGLGRKPTSYKLPPGDAELSVQMLRFYDYTSAALEPQVLDFYHGVDGGKWRALVPKPPPSPSMQQKVSELSLLRQQLVEMQKNQREQIQEEEQQPLSGRLHFSRHQQSLLTSPSTPTALGKSATGLDYISFGDGATALKTPSAFGGLPAPPSTTHQRTLQLQRELAAAKAELETLPR